MLLTGIAGTELSARDIERLRVPQVSGVVLFARNFVSREQVTALIDAMREVRGDDDFIVGVDQEGGRVQRFREGFTALPPLARIGERHSEDPGLARALAEEHAWLMASEMRAVGVDISFAPVIDLARGNRAIGDRAFHADPEVVAELADAYIRGMHMAGMAATIKHFPGHGSVAEDTHVDVARDSRDMQAICAEDLVPFADCIALGVEAVMMAHVIYPAIDDTPAGRSPVWIGQILRQELGFEGIVFSDDISMAAAGEGDAMRQRVLAHLEAGCDLILACQPDAFEAAIEAVDGLAPCDRARVATLRGEAAAGWDALIDNPQRDRFLARLAMLQA
ncbi:beta-N-acetylhexosaminidase [Oleiagrimonas sp. C23AA]|uniref:beta-N-acetylhexosaminidase n=1 Tax=Oleiagrimonas sp. C23AA TaxID=2719047 RepID=UPI001421D534|nr:beta-N-acetylhexosaminidase [Oleiagrimonas sp. C23AA]NII10403.1 beta-N-acetylhexosaminidase [Oleiagrimonas sp. C23AA]